ncbi:hypothetical protein ACFSKU_09820 [Pontibacter silvestris]|uniref:Uncharacterized protein n=1 Tax=Pontibacter silvestris TaxID=2305183 RepID=A0ABW4WWR5_9BACT|nr:hypothetical protein [Pontibacter silvestris]MCC9136865.1 hypothetical protein [Pontibacter silvestris]
MATSNKLLLGLLIVILLFLTVIMGVSKYYAVEGPVSSFEQQEAPMAPEAPHAPEAE